MTFKWLVVGLALLTGCGNSATVARGGARSVDGEIVGGDRDTIYVDGPAGVEAIPRSEVTDVDHPGNVAAILGGVVTAYGIVNIAVGAPQCEQQGAAFCTGVFIPAAIGLPIMSYGIGTYAGSVSSLNDAPEQGRRGRLVVMPTHQFAGQPETPGVSVGGTF
jgi:hypothetical protein